MVVQAFVLSLFKLLFVYLPPHLFEWPLKRKGKIKYVATNIWPKSKTKYGSCPYSQPDHIHEILNGQSYY